MKILALHYQEATSYLSISTIKIYQHKPTIQYIIY